MRSIRRITMQGGFNMAWPLRAGVLMVAVVTVLAACRNPTGPELSPGGDSILSRRTGQGSARPVAALKTTAPTATPAPRDPQPAPTPSPTATPGAPGPTPSPAIAPTPEPTSDVPTPVPTLNITPATPTPAPAAGDVIYLGAFKASTLAGGTVGRPADGNGATAVLGQSMLPCNLALELGTRLWFTDARANQLRMLDLASGSVERTAGDPSGRTSGADTTVAYMELPAGLAYDVGRKVIYSSNGGQAQIYRFNRLGNTVDRPGFSFDLLAGGPFGAPRRDGPGSGPGVLDATRATFATPQAMALVGNALYIAEADGADIRKIDLGSTNFDVTTLAAGNTAGGPPATREEVNERLSAKFGIPAGLVASLDGKTLYVADAGTHLIRAIDLSSPTGKVTIFAGTLQAGFKDGAPSVAAFNRPVALAIDKDFLYVGEGENHRVRAVSLADRSVKTLLGKIDAGGGIGDNTTATFGGVTGLTAELNPDNSLKTLYAYDAGTPTAGGRLVAVRP